MAVFIFCCRKYRKSHAFFHPKQIRIQKRSAHKWYSQVRYFVLITSNTKNRRLVYHFMGKLTLKKKFLTAAIFFQKFQNWSNNSYKVQILSLNLLNLKTVLNLEGKKQRSCRKRIVKNSKKLTQKN